MNCTKQCWVDSEYSQILQLKIKIYIIKVFPCKLFICFFRGIFCLGLSLKPHLSSLPFSYLFNLNLKSNYMGTSSNFPSLEITGELAEKILGLKLFSFLVPYLNKYKIFPNPKFLYVQNESRLELSIFMFRLKGYLSIQIDSIITTHYNIK